MSTVLWIIFLTLPTLFTIAAVYIFYNHVKKIKLILQLPGPKRHPVLGNILDVAVDQGNTMYKIVLLIKILFY